MTYQDVFNQFWKRVEESVEEENFAKLTMAKTIGKTNLKNIFIRPLYNKEGFKVLLKYHFRSKDSEDVEELYTLEEACDVVRSHLRQSFFNVILFSTQLDITFKINKKGAGSIVESAPTFSNIAQE